MLLELSSDQLAEWWAYHERNSWTPERNDLRQEVLIHRLLGLWTQTPSESLPTPFYPYFEEEPDPAEVIKAIRETQANTERTEDGGYRWKNGNVNR